MSEKTDIIESKDKNIDPIILNIMTEALQEFKGKYGDKHLARIKEKIESITDKVEKSIMYYNAPIATAHHQFGIRYTESEKLTAILKHELWHVYNNSTVDDISLQHTPKRYVDVLDKNGYLRELHKETMDEYMRLFADTPDRLEFLLVDYETFVEKYGFDHHEVEKWTEWFNTKTHENDMQEHYWDWDDGFYTKQKSSGSFYDAYRSLPEMISCIIPQDKLLDMYLQTSDYKTDYSYPEMMEDFDNQFVNSLDDKEKEIYRYPYLKLIMDTKVIDENARTNPRIAREALQSSMKTIFNAYLIKLDSIKDIDIDQAKEIYAQIKNMQDHMIWNTDISKMQDLEYVKSMEDIQQKFQDMLQTLDLSSPEVTDMLKGIDYKSNNQYKQIEEGREISEKIISTKNIDKQKSENIGEYSVEVGNNGIKDNIYASLFILLEDEKFNLLFEEIQQENSFDKEKNIMLNIHRQISEAKTDEEYIAIYDRIYELFKEKIDKNLNLNQSIDTLFSKYSNHIVELQKHALFNENTNRYLPSLESIIELYNKKVMDFEKVVDETTSKKLELELSREDGNIEVTKSWYENFAKKFKVELFNNLSRIDEQRLEQNSYKDMIRDNNSTENKDVNNDKDKQQNQEPYIDDTGVIHRPEGSKDETEEVIECPFPIGTNIMQNVKNIAVNEKSRDIQQGSKDVKTTFREVESPIQTKEDGKKIDD